MNEMMESQKIRVVIVDDHNMVRKGLRVLLEEFDDLVVVNEAGDGEAAVDICRSECPADIPTLLRRRDCSRRRERRCS